MLLFRCRPIFGGVTWLICGSQRFKHLNILLFYRWALVRSSLSDSSSKNSRKNDASLSLDDEEEEEITEEVTIFFPFSLLGFLEVSRGSMTCSWNVNLAAVPLDGLHLDDKLHFVEEPLEIVGREVKRLKRSRIPLVKVRWNSKRGPEFTWEREDQFEKKYPHLFTKTTPSSSAAL
ncbi:hypothetical protein Tco_1376510 [Tanacetum coccineum]